MWTTMVKMRNLRRVIFKFLHHDRSFGLYFQNWLKAFWPEFCSFWFPNVVWFVIFVWHFICLFDRNLLNIVFFSKYRGQNRIPLSRPGNVGQKNLCEFIHNPTHSTPPRIKNKTFSRMIHVPNFSCEKNLIS